MNSLINDAIAIKQMVDELKSYVDANIELYSMGLITFEEFTDAVAEYQQVYQSQRKKEHDLLMQTPAFSEERYELLKVL